MRGDERRTAKVTHAVGPVQIEIRIEITPKLTLVASVRVGEGKVKAFGLHECDNVKRIFPIWALSLIYFF